MLDSPLVSFVIPVRNDAAGLRRCLGSIAASDYPRERLEILVADNGSEDDSRTVAREAGARLLELPGLSVAALRNRAARETEGTILAFIDADHEIEPGWVRAAVEVLESSETGAVGAPYLTCPRPTWVQRAYGALRNHPREARRVAWLGSGNLAVRRDLFERVGGFDESLTTCEDVDLCARLRAEGLEVVSDPRLRSVHHGDPATLGELFRSELWRGRDNLRVALKNGISLRDVPGIAMPGLYLLSLVMILAGILSGFSAPLVACGAGGVLLLGLVRTAVMARNDRALGPLSLARKFLVASVYEASRALALVVRVGHRRTRP